MGIADYSTTPASNTAINGINIAEGCAPANINNAIRQMMADLAAFRDELVSGAAAYGFLPIGTIILWGDDSPPANLLRLNGAAISRVTYAALFAKWGTRFGVGDGSTTFNLPNVSGRSLLAAGNGAGLTPRAVGAIGGEETHQLTEAQLPSHGHPFSGTTGTAGRHAHGNVPPRADANRARGGDNSFFLIDALGGMTDEAGEHSHPFSGTTAGVGGGQAHNNMSPFFVFNVVVRAL